MTVGQAFLQSYRDRFYLVRGGIREIRIVQECSSLVGHKFFLDVTYHLDKRYFSVLIREYDGWFLCRWEDSFQRAKQAVSILHMYFHMTALEFSFSYQENGWKADRSPHVEPGFVD